MAQESCKRLGWLVFVCFAADCAVKSAEPLGSASTTRGYRERKAKRGVGAFAFAIKDAIESHSPDGCGEQGLMQAYGRNQRLTVPGRIRNIYTPCREVAVERCIVARRPTENLPSSQERT